MGGSEKGCIKCVLGDLKGSFFVTVNLTGAVVFIDEEKNHV